MDRSNRSNADLNLDVDTGNEGTEIGATSQDKQDIRSGARLPQKSSCKHCAPLSRTDIPSSKSTAQNASRMSIYFMREALSLRNAASIID